MRQLKEMFLFMAATLLQQAAQQLYLAGFREHVKTCPNHHREESGAVDRKSN